jgi:hypothetical protein
VSTNDIFEGDRKIEIAIEIEMESFTGLQRNFSEAELPKMP